MVKTRRSTRVRKKKSSTSTSKLKTRKSNSKTSSKEQTLASTDSETSPFKGYDIAKNEEVNEQKCFGNLSNETSNLEVKDVLFSKLVEEDPHPNLHRNIKTYSNKNKGKGLTENKLLEFHDCKNRDEIIHWLNDNRNVFDRLTQTQPECVNVNTDTQMTLDMPSVSQQNTSKVNRPRRETKKVHQSGYKLRAKSLDIHIKKNSGEGRSRNKSCSLAGDTSPLENYNIEDVRTEDDVAVSAEKDAKVILDLMEDAYLNNIEQEMLQHEEKKNQCCSGWDRIKDFNKSINKKKPKQLKILLQSNQNKKCANNTNNNVPSYDYEVLENYFIENMEKLLEDGDESNGKKSSNDESYSSKNVLQVGKHFVTILKKMVENEGNESLSKFESVILELKEIFGGIMKETATQTQTLITFNKITQTEITTTNRITQTESNLVNIGIQTDNDISNRTEKSIQTNNTNKTSVEVQTSDDFLLKDRGSEEDVQQKSDVFDDDLVFDFNTEDMLKNESKTVEKNEVEIRETVIIVLSGESVNENKGVKRLSESPVQDLKMHPLKRPCAKFVREDLSIGFSSCADQVDENKNVWSEEIDDECVTKLLNEYEDNTKRPSIAAKTRAPEQMEEKFDTKPSYSTNEEIQIQQEACPVNKLEDDMDYFKPALETTLKKSRRSLFGSKNEKCTTPPNKFSESLFDDGNITVVTNQTMTQDKVDRMPKIFDSDETFKRVKVNILENVIVKESDDNDVKNGENMSEISDDVHLSEIDVVESTPQKKKFSSFNDQKGEALLDITLPPPLEFQDSEKIKVDLNTSLVLDIDHLTGPSRRSLAPINKVTSTPISQKPMSESFLNLSPISCYGKIPTKLNTPKSSPRTIPNQENKRIAGPFEYAQQQLSKFSPLTIIRKPYSQDCRFSAAPKQKSILNYVRPSQESQECQKSESFESSRNRKPCVACTRVSKDQVIEISSLTNKKLVTYSTTFTQKVTHLIVAVNERNCLKDHTIKYVLAVASGIWVLSFGWVRECRLKNALVPEEPYEVKDVSGVPGPRLSRLSRSTSPLLKGFKVHAAAPFVSTSRQEVENLVRLLGGKVVPSPEHLLDKNGYICVIVTEAKATQDFELYETWLEALKVVTVDIEWLSRSVGQYKLLSLHPFTLCSDDGIENLGYPPELTQNMTYSFSQQTFSSAPSST